MKHIVKHFYSYIVLIINCFFPRFRARNTLFWNIKIGGRRVVRLKNAYLHKTRINVSGRQHKIFIKGSIYNSEINVYGMNNRIMIGESCDVHDANITLRGNNLLFYIGKNSRIGGGRFIVMGQSNKIVIGTNCMLSDQLELWNTDSHPICDMDMNVINPSAPIIIKNSVWIGAHVTVLKGITIGEGAIIGMNAVVTRDVQSQSVCVGNPARVVRSNVTWKREFITV